MAAIWTLLLLLSGCGGLTATKHRDEKEPSGEVAIGHRRSLHTTEGHRGPSAHSLPELLPVALPLQQGSLDLPLTKALADKSHRKSPGLRKKRERPQTSPAVLGQLGQILKDDDDQSLTSKRKRVPPDVKRQATLKPNDTILPEEAGADRKQQTFEDWLRDEYFRNMALSIATVKRKRSSLQDGRRKRSSRHDDALGVAKEAKLRLQTLENAVLADALSEIVSRRQDVDSAEGEAADQRQRGGEEEEEGGESGGAEEGESLVARRLAQAYYLERLRGAVDKLQEAQDAWGSFQDGADDRAQDTEQYSYDKRNNGKHPSLPVPDSAEDKHQAEEDMCPALRMLTSDCSSLEEVLNGGEMSQALRRACNKHEVCYSCGEAFGLTSSSCDRVFLSDVSDACRACSERALGQLLVPLRDQRVFYKRTVPPLCYRSPCVQAFLEEHY